MVTRHRELGAPARAADPIFDLVDPETVWVRAYVDEALSGRLAAVPGVEKVDIAGPGFINLRLADAVWIEELRALANLGADYGRSTAGGGSTVNVEYVSANPTGPMHMGHCRGAVVGDALADLLAYSGHKVIK